MNDRYYASTEISYHLNNLRFTNCECGFIKAIFLYGLMNWEYSIGGHRISPAQSALGDADERPSNQPASAG